MSYHPNKTRSIAARQGMGDLESLVIAGINIANDPYLNEVICRARQLQAVKAKTAVPVCPNTAPGIPGGIGLERAVVPMRAYVYAEEHKWVYLLAGVGIIGLPLLIGYELGKGH